MRAIARQRYVPRPRATRRGFGGGSAVLPWWTTYPIRMARAKVRREGGFAGWARHADHAPRRAWNMAVPELSFGGDCPDEVAADPSGPFRLPEKGGGAAGSDLPAICRAGVVSTRPGRRPQGVVCTRILPAGGPRLGGCVSVRRRVGAEPSRICLGGMQAGCR